MTKYLISFPSRTMVVPDGEWEATVEDSHAVMREAREAGVYVFAGGLDEALAPATVAADGTVTPAYAPETEKLDGGWCVLDLPTYDDALAWAARIAAACRAPQEVRAFMHDPES